MNISKLNYIGFIAILSGVCVSLVSSSKGNQKHTGHSSKCIVSGRNHSVLIEAKQWQTRALVYGFLSPDGNRLNITNAFNKTQHFGILRNNSFPWYCEKLKKLVNLTKSVASMNLSITPLTFVLTSTTNVTNVTEFLNNVTKCLNDTGYEFGNDSVFTIHGKRNLYSWMSVNLLLGRFENATNSTATALDLGTMYSHEEFENSSIAGLTEEERKQVTNVTVCQKNYTLMGSSELGLGLYEARLQIFNQSNMSISYMEEYTPQNVYFVPHNNTHNASVLNGTAGEIFSIINVVSPCLRSNGYTQWVHKNELYNITGPDTNSTGVNMTECRKLVDNVIKNHTRKGPGLLGKELYGLAYYYKVLHEAKITTRGQNKNITVQEIEEQANKTCNKPYKDEELDKTDSTIDKPFDCMDLIYIHELLTQFYKLENHTSIEVVLKLNGVNADWTLGMAYDRYQQQQTNNGKKKVKKV